MKLNLWSIPFQDKRTNERADLIRQVQGPDEPSASAGIAMASRPGGGLPTLARVLDSGGWTSRCRWSESWRPLPESLGAELTNQTMAHTLYVSLEHARWGRCRGALSNLEGATYRYK